MRRDTNLLPGRSWEERLIPFFFCNFFSPLSPLPSSCMVLLSPHLWYLKHSPGPGRAGGGTSMGRELVSLCP